MNIKIKELKQKGFYIEKHSQKNTSSVQYLYEKCFNIKISAEQINHKHIHCHGKKKFFAFIAFCDKTNEPAAYYAVYPNYIINNGGVSELIAQSGDTMTNTKFRKKGLFIDLAKLTFEHCSKNNINLIIGVPNKNSYPGFIKYLEFKEVNQIKKVVLFENKFHYSRVFSRVKILNEIYVKLILKIIRLMSSDDTEIKNSNLNDPKLHYMLHDTYYYSLKNSRNNFLINFFGTKIFIKVEKNHIIIGDIDINERLDRIINFLKIFTFFSGNRFLVFSSTDNGYLFRKLIKKTSRIHNQYPLIVKEINNKFSADAISFLGCDTDTF